MPVYEYRCQDCNTVNSVFFRSISAARDPSCSQCGSTRMQRLISRAFYVKGDRGRLEEFDTDRLIGKLNSRDPGDFARWARQVDAEVGTALGTNFRELAEKAEAGEDPIERYDPAHTLRYAHQKTLSEVYQQSSESGDSSSSDSDL